MSVYRLDSHPPSKDTPLIVRKSWACFFGLHNWWPTYSGMICSDCLKHKETK